MSRRLRALGFLAVSLVCAGLAATMVGGYGESVTGQLGELRSVLVAKAELPARREITPARAHRGLEVRRVPERFVPPAVLSSEAEAIGREPLAPISAGAYVSADQLRISSDGRRRPRALDAGLSPVQIQVVGAGALTETPAGDAVVDVIVTSEPDGSQSGSTYLAASAVPLLSLSESAAGPGDAALSGVLPTYLATLALTRSQALRLIEAENFARQVRLVPSQ